MGRFAAAAFVQAPCEHVFDYRLNVLNLPDYNPAVTNLRALQSGPASEGSAYEFQLRLAGGFRVPVRLTVETAERPRRIEFLIDSVMRAHEICLFEPDGNRTRVDFETTINTPGGRLGRLMDTLFVLPNARRQVLEELQLIKARFKQASLTG